MKRGRLEEIQFGPRTGPTTTHHRIITSTPHIAGNPTIQYQISNVHREAPTVVAQTQNVQYTNYNASTITANKANAAPNQGSGVPVQVVQTGSVNTSVVRQKGPPPPGNVNVAMSQSVSSAPQAQSTGAGQAQFQRLKVEDALSYLDQVKYKFGNQPQVYNDFLDIMKEFKSQSIDTPGVIQRVSNLFKGHPELIVGFNTFLPPGYKIEVQANDQGYAYQVSVSVPSPSGNTISIPTEPSPPHNKVQILQGSGQIVHSLSSTVNLNHPHTMHTMHSLQPPQQAQQQQQQQSSGGQHQQTILPQQINTITIPIPQNYSRDRERSLSGNSVNQSPQTPSSTTPQSTNQTHQPQANATILSESSGLHRISQQLLQQSEQNNQNQPVEFNHAISYVNKIKNRFQNQPEKYKRFLEILHTYQKEQKVGDKLLTEAEVYTQVAKLFDNQEDLLREFGQFLPDATSIGSGSASSGVRNNKNQNALQDLGNLKKLSSSSGPPNAHANMKAYSLNSLTRTLDARNNVSGPNNMQMSSLNMNEFHNFANNDKEYGMQSYHSGGARDKDGRNHHLNNQKYGPMGGSNNNNSNIGGIKRSPSYNVMPINHLNRGHASDRSDQPPMKRHKPICRDVSLAEASKYGTLNDYAFFDKVRKALRTPDVYDNFLRCLTLYNQEIVSKSELITLVTPFLIKSPDLLRWFQDFLGPSNSSEGIPMASAQRQDHRSQTELAQDIDLTQCKRLGASYCALPKPNEVKKCSGRTTLCREVLNDVWVSFPTWAEDSTFVTSRKTQYEEFIYRCEDERFELDVVIETNSATIRVLEGVQKKLSRMSPDEVARYRLDDCLGGTSPTIHQRAMRRIYGEKSSDIIQGLKKNPVVAVPVVLRRLKAKEEEWREAQKGFNKQWREQNEKYYLKSLDHQGINFKQNDVKALRSKSLFNEIETLYDERHEQNEEGATNEPLAGPHLILPYKDKTILEDAANLLIHHVKRQTGIQKQEKARIKHILRQFVPDLFFSPRQPLSDDEREDAEDTATENLLDDKASKSDVLPTTSTAIADAKSNEDSSCIKDTPSPDTNLKCNPVNDKLISLPQSADISSDLTKSRKNSVNNTQNANAETATENAACTVVDGIKVEIKQETDDVITSASNSSHTLPTTGNQQLPPHAVSKHPEEAYTLFLANNNWYLFLRLHSILCERLRTMYERTQVLVAEEEVHKTSRRESTAVSLRLKPQSDTEISEYYPTFLDMLKNLLDGNLDANNYEDKLRDMFGIHAYIAFTLDRVVSNAVRQLQHCVTERGALECVELFQLESRKNGAGGICRTANKRLAAELAYQRRAESSLQDENCFKVFIYKIDCRITIELLDTETEDASTTNVSNVQAWSKYTEGYINPAALASQSSSALGSLSLNKNRSNSYNGGVIDPMSTNVEIKTERPDDEVNTAPRRPLFLARNIRKFNKKNVPNSKDSIVMTPGNEERVRLDDASDCSIISRVQSNDTEKMSTSINSTAASCTLTTSMSSIPPPFIPLGITPPANVVTDTFWNKRPPERIGTLNTDSSIFVDDRQQIKLNVNTFKMVFLGNDYFFYKKQCLKRAKQTHPQVSKTMHEHFDAFVQRWLDTNVSDIQRITLDDWLLGRNQNDLVPCKTFVLRDNNIKETPYYSYSRYTVKYATES